MTLLIGTTAGACDRGIARLRKAPAAGVFYIGEDPGLSVLQNDYLTVIDDFGLFAKHSFGPYLDIDTAYSDQFTNFLPVPLMGSHAVIHAGDTIGFYAAGSWVPGSTIASHAWAAPGATATDGLTGTTPTMTYGTSGRFRVSYTPTAANGKAFTGYRYVYVLGDNLAAETDFTIEQVEGDSDDGWTMKLTCIDRPTIVDNARVILYAEAEYYDNELSASIGPETGRENIIFIGNIIGESIVRQPGWDRVEFEAVGPVGLMSMLACNQTGLTDTSFPTDAGTTLPVWAKMASLTATKGLHYLMMHRSTVGRLYDITVEDWGYAAAHMEGGDGSLLGQVTDYASTAALTVRADRYGHIYCQRDAQLYPVDDRDSDIVEVLTLADSDWWDDKGIVRRHIGRVSTAKAEGHIFASGIETQVGGISPGDAPARYGGGGDDLQYLYVTTIGDVLELAGLLCGSQNAQYEAIVGKVGGMLRLIDVAPRQYVNDTVDGSVIRCVPRRVSYSPIEGSGFWITDIELEQEGAEWETDEIVYPGDGEEPAEPPTEPPEDPPEPPTEPPYEPPEQQNLDAIVTITNDVRTVEHLGADPPVWETEKTTLPTDPIVDSSMVQGELHHYLITESEIYRSQDISVAGAAGYSSVYDAADFTLGTDLRLLRIITPGAGRRGDASVIYVLGYATNTGATKSAYCGVSNNGGQTWNWYEIGEIEDPGEPFTLGSTAEGTHNNTTTTFSGGGGSVICTVVFSGGSEGGNPFQWTSKNIEVILPDPVPLDPIDDSVSLEYDYIGDSPSLNYDTAGNCPAFIDYSTYIPVVEGSFSAISGGYHFTGEIHPSRMVDRSILHVGWHQDRSGRWANSTATTRSGTFCNLVIGGVEYSADVSKAFDAANTNTSWVYYGATDKIWKSENGGVDWEILHDDYGAYDVFVDPLLAGVIYFWTTTGDLRMSIAGVVDATALDTETPYNQHTRIAMGAGLAKMFTLTGDGKIRVRALGTWSDKKTGITGGKSLTVHTWYDLGMLFFLDALHIWYSDDGGDTWVEKEGEWSEFAGAAVAGQILSNWFAEALE